MSTPRGHNLQNFKSTRGMRGKTGHPSVAKRLQNTAVCIMTLSK